MPFVKDITRNKTFIHYHKIEIPLNRLQGFQYFYTNQKTEDVANRST